MLVIVLSLLAVVSAAKGSSSSSSGRSSSPSSLGKGGITKYGGSSSSFRGRAAGSYLLLNTSPWYRSRYRNDGTNQQPTEELSFSVLSIILILLSPVLMFHTFLYPDTRWALLVSGGYAGMAVVMASFYLSDDRSGVASSSALVIGITTLMALVGGLASFFVTSVGRALTGFLAGLCFGTYLLCMKSGGLFPDSYAGRVAFVSVFAAIGFVCIHFKRHHTMIIATAFIGTFTLFYAISDIDGASFHLAPIWLLVMTNAADLYQMEVKDKLIVGFLGVIFVSSVVAQYYIDRWARGFELNHARTENRSNGDGDIVHAKSIPFIISMTPLYLSDTPSLNNPDACQLPPPMSYDVPFMSCDAM